jgi:hypothetical protein
MGGCRFERLGYSRVRWTSPSSTRNPRSSRAAPAGPRSPAPASRFQAETMSFSIMFFVLMMARWCKVEPPKQPGNQRTSGHDAGCSGYTKGGTSTTELHDRPIRLGLGFSDATARSRNKRAGLRLVLWMRWLGNGPNHEGVARGAAIPLPYRSKLRISSSLVRLPFTLRFAV